LEIKQKKRKTNTTLRARIYISEKTIAEIAKEIGMSNVMLSRRIHGFMDFTQQHMEDISKALNVPVAELFFFEDKTEEALE
jgi:transcriptional regulator with XRE-family HTH domain